VPHLLLPGRQSHTEPSPARPSESANRTHRWPPPPSSHASSLSPAAFSCEWDHADSSQPHEMCRSDLPRTSLSLASSSSSERWLAPIRANSGQRAGAKRGDRWFRGAGTRWQPHALSGDWVNRCCCQVTAGVGIRPASDGMTAHSSQQHIVGPALSCSLYTATTYRVASQRGRE
jgi:hypothetical protein